MLKEHPSNPPTAMEFVLLCKVRPEDEGYPSPEEAYQQAMGNNPNKHPIVSLTCREMGTRASDMRQMLDNQARKLFVGFYLEVVDKVIKGHLELPKAIAEDSVDVGHKSELTIVMHANTMKELKIVFP
jgi:hypothetical protein